MIRDLLFRPTFNLADMLTMTLACGLMLSGHWLACIPVLVLGAVVYGYGRKQLRRMPAIRVPRKVR